MLKSGLRINRFLFAATSVGCSVQSRSSYEIHVPDLRRPGIRRDVAEAADRAGHEGVPGVRERSEADWPLGRREHARHEDNEDHPGTQRLGLDERRAVWENEGAGGRLLPR